MNYFKISIKLLPLFLFLISCSKNAENSNQKNIGNNANYPLTLGYSFPDSPSFHCFRDEKDKTNSDTFVAVHCSDSNVVLNMWAPIFSKNEQLFGRNIVESMEIKNNKPSETIVELTTLLSKRISVSIEHHYFNKKNFTFIKKVEKLSDTNSFSKTNIQYIFSPENKLFIHPLLSENADEVQIIPTLNSSKKGDGITKMSIIFYTSEDDSLFTINGIENKITIYKNQIPKTGYTELIYEIKNTTTKDVKLVKDYFAIQNHKIKNTNRIEDFMSKRFYHGMNYCDFFKRHNISTDFTCIDCQTPIK